MAKDSGHGGFYFGHALILATLWPLMRLAAVLWPAGQNAAKIQALDVFWPRMRLAAVLWLAGQNSAKIFWPRILGYIYIYIYIDI